jgi:methylmalonyl-CoA mutase N-terminal domain/subunit
MTADIERRVGDYFARIDELGGMVRAIEAGYPQREIERRAYEHQRAVERKERIVVGVNDFVLAEEAAIPIAMVDPALETDQIKRVRAVRARRSAAEVTRALAALDDAATGTANLVTPIVGAVKALATVGEIADVMRKRFGEFHPTR